MTAKAAAALICLAGALMLAGCSKGQLADTLARTAEGAIRSACQDADNCTNRCADGSPWRNSRMRCP